MARVVLTGESADARFAQGTKIMLDISGFEAGSVAVALTGAVRPGVAVACGVYWNKFVPGGTNVNATTPTALTDMGGGATFFDNLVEVA